MNATSDLTKEEILEIFRDEYMTNGYISSGELSPHSAIFVKCQPLLRELYEAGVLGYCEQSHNLLLSFAERWKLIKECKLEIQWKRSAPKYRQQQITFEIDSVKSVMSRLETFSSEVER